MGMVIGLKIGICVLGAVLLWLDLMAYVRKKMTDSMSVFWAIFAVAIIVAGKFVKVQEVCNVSTLWVLFFLVAVVIFFLFGVTVTVSGLVAKNQELAMQVSLLNQENEHLLYKINKIMEKQ